MHSADLTHVVVAAEVSHDRLEAWTTSRGQQARKQAAWVTIAWLEACISQGCQASENGFRWPFPNADQDKGSLPQTEPQPSQPRTPKVFSKIALNTAASA